jgi:drug/metabolite transporter (DMT)-like permease
MIYFCFINTGLAFLFYFAALKRVDTSLVSMTFFVKPLLASLFAALFLGELITPQIVAGIVLVAGGIYLVIKSGTVKKHV